MKNDQAGDRPRDPRHVYANPLEPTICPILALGVYWSMFTFDQANGRFFLGGSQYDRFCKQLGRIFNQDDVSNELKRRAVKPDEIGTHSLRKGAATFASSGSTACPTSTAVNLRAGWSLGGVQNTYLRYEAAGDMHVGRTVTGLPTVLHTFACLPPHFSSCDDQVEKGNIHRVSEVPGQHSLYPRVRVGIVSVPPRISEENASSLTACSAPRCSPRTQCLLSWRIVYKEGRYNLYAQTN